jgi:ferrochelatase
VAAFVKQAGVPAGKYSVSFQSRLGRDPWLKPYTDFELPRLAQSGVKRLLVMCPAFVSDCLETLEEIGLRGREAFLEAGGTESTLIPCLNEHPLWLEALENMVSRFLLAPGKAQRGPKALA